MTTHFADPTFISPMVDFGFNTLFGTQRNINLLRRLLETVFKCSIPDIRFINIEHQGDSEEDRKAYFD
ncbi:MAG: PD-(D/E)XK nuclease family transposase, partial [Bacteroidales bacterium]|nr:PD-(D/E)XK nuclease family transposase [Bacteroidales bacterium]